MGLFKPNIDKMYDKNDIDGLIKALNHRKRFVRQDAANHLGRIGDKNAIDPLIKTLSDQDDSVRLNAVLALGRIGDTKDTKVIDSLINALSDQSGPVREKTVEALGCIGGNKAVLPLFDITAKDKSPHIRKKAGEIIEEIAKSNKQFIQELDPLLQVRYCILLEAWDNAAKYGDLAIAPLIEKLRMIISDASEALRLAMIYLYGAGIGECLQVIDTLETQEEKAISLIDKFHNFMYDIEGIFDTLLDQGGSHLIAEIYNLLNDNYTTLRSLALRAIIWLDEDDKKLVDTLKNSLDSSDEKYKIWVRSTLEKIESDLIIEYFDYSELCKDMINDTIELCKKFSKEPEKSGSAAYRAGYRAMPSSAFNKVIVKAIKDEVFYNLIYEVTGGKGEEELGLKYVSFHTEQGIAAYETAKSELNETDEIIALELLECSNHLDEIRAKEIGEQLNKSGGIEKMKLVCYRVMHLGGSARWIEAKWHGIGDWWG